MEFTVYRIDTGEILRTGTCQPSDLDMQAYDGEAVIEGAYKDSLYYYDGDNMVKKPTMPSIYHDWDAASKSWVLNSDRLNAVFRAQRNEMLAACDWTQMPDVDLTDAKKQEWAAYRQALRDLPANTTDPANPDWPLPPS